MCYYVGEWGERFLVTRLLVEVWLEASQLPSAVGRVRLVWIHHPWLIQEKKSGQE